MVRCRTSSLEGLVVKDDIASKQGRHAVKVCQRGRLAGFLTSLLYNIIIAVVLVAILITTVSVWWQTIMRMAAVAVVSGAVRVRVCCWELVVRMLWMGVAVGIVPMNVRSSVFVGMLFVGVA